MKKAALILVLLLVVSLTVAKKEKKQKKKKAQEKSAAPQEQSVWERDLIKEDIKSAHILKNFMSYSTVQSTLKNFKGPTLGFVTPWFNHGYDTAKMFGNKFNIISPTWMASRPLPDGRSFVAGLHDYDKDWIEEVRKAEGIKIVPRIVLEGWGDDDFDSVLGTEENIQKYANHFLRICEEKNFDGIVLEIWLQLFPKRDDLIHLIQHIADVIKQAGKIFVLVLPPPLGRGMLPLVTPQEVEDLSDFVDYFTLMTYDYSSPKNPGPVAPIKWMKENVEYLAPEKDSKVRKQMLMGMNFYGLKDENGKGEAIFKGDDYAELLDSHTPKFTWNPETAEHTAEYTAINTAVVKIRYPTLLSIKKRIQLAEDLGVGISIWELGQGLDYFFDLL